MTYRAGRIGRQGTIYALVLVVLAALAASASGQPAVPRMPDQSIKVDETTRWYKVYKPANLAPGAPAIVLLHGGTGSMYTIFGKRRAKGTHAWLDVAKRHGALLIVPNASNNQGDARGERQNWNDGRDSTFTTRADDVGFIVQLVEHMTAKHDLDPTRIYATGSSNGGMMTYRLLIDAPGVFAAGAAFIANLPRDLVHATKSLPPPVPIMIVTGTNDRLMPYDGGQILRNRAAVLSSANTAAWWARVNNAGPPGDEHALPDAAPDDGCRLVVTEYPARDGKSAPVTMIRMDGGGHAMPTKLARTVADSRVPLARLIGTVCNDAEGAELAWAFFQHTKR